MSDDGIDFDELTSGAGPSGLTYDDLQEDPAAAGLSAELDLKKAARQLALPTNDQEVRRRLRAHGEPITLFGEKNEDRRERLRGIIVRLRQAKGLDVNISDDEGSQDEKEEEEEEKEEEFYTEGEPELEKARRYMAAWAMPRAKQRIERQRREANTPLARILDTRKAVFAELKTYTSLGSQFADERPISSVRFSPNSQYIATGSWSGTCKIWSIPDCRQLDELKGHNGERIGGVAWHPSATLGGYSRESVNLASSGAGGEICLWNLSGVDADPTTKKPTAPSSTLTGHSHRVCKLSFHPSGNYLSSASYDGTWRLWDVATSSELLLQEGHSKEVYTVAFHPLYGSLLASGGLDAIGRVWDTRSGRSVMVLEGHRRDILSIDWSEGNGYQLATGSNDDTVKIWDMRKLKCLYTIPAHKSTVSDVKFFKAQDGMESFPRTIVKQEEGAANSSIPNGVNGIKKEEDEEQDVKPDISMDVDIAKPSAISTNGDVPLSGMYLASSGYDGNVKIWSADDWQLVKTLNSEAGGRVMSVDLAGNGKYLATGEWSRTFKLFAAADVAL